MGQTSSNSEESRTEKKGGGQLRSGVENGCEDGEESEREFPCEANSAWFDSLFPEEENKQAKFGEGDEAGGGGSLRHAVLSESRDGPERWGCGASWSSVLISSESGVNEAGSEAEGD